MHAQRPRVLLLCVSRDGRLSSPGLWVPELLALCGACPALGERPGDAPGAAVPWPDVLAADPDMLVLVNDEADCALAALPALCRARRWWGLRCVASGSVALLGVGLTTHAGPRVVEGAELLGQLLGCARPGGRAPGQHAGAAAADRPGGSGIGGRAQLQGEAGLTCGGCGRHGCARKACQRGQPRPPAPLSYPARGPVCALKLSLHGGQRCRAHMLPNYFVPLVLVGQS